MAGVWEFLKRADLTLRGKKELEILGVQSVLEGAFRR